MTITLELTPEEFSILTARADADGVPISDVLRRLIAQLAPPPKPPAPTAALLSSLRGETPTDDPEEIAEREREHQEMQSNIARWRAEQGRA